MSKITVLLAFVLLIPLAIHVVPSIPTNVAAECKCTDLEALQIELRNAQRLQQAFRNKIPDLRTMNRPTSMSALKQFAETDARKGLEKPTNSTGPAEVDFTAQGDLLSDPTHPPSTATNESLCKMSPGSAADLQNAMQKAACAGVGNALKAHEDVHASSCLRRGYMNFFNMTGADRAEEEVAAYGAQINALRAEIAQVLGRSQFTVISDMKTKTKVPQNPLYTTIGVDNHAEILTSSASGSTERFRLEGQGQQTNNATVDGNCSFTGGVPYNLPAKISIDTDGLTAEVTYELTGTPPSIAIKCTIPGAGSGYGMSLPVQIDSGKVPVAKMPLKNGAEVVFDMAQSEAAKILAGGGVTLTGTATVRLVCKN